VAIDEPVMVRRRARWRLAVHLGLILTATASLVIEPVLTLHIALGLAFVGFVIAHLAQRRHTTARLFGRLARAPSPSRAGDRLALSTALL
jgi:hypothetical protein